MVVSGDGGDEVFAGYSYFPKMRQRFPPPAGPLDAARRKFGRLLRALKLRPPSISPVEIWHDRTSYFGDDLRRKLWQSDYQHLIDETREWNRRQFQAINLRDADSKAMKAPGIVECCQYHDLNNYLVYDNLTKVDIASMCHSIEVRVPLLDHHLVDIATQIPTEFKFSPPTTSQDFWNIDHQRIHCKLPLRRASESFFPTHFYNREKMGFSLPMSEWVKEPQFKDHFMDTCDNLSDFFSLREIHRLYDEHLRTNQHGWRIWSLTFLSHWIHSQATPVGSSH